MFRPFRLRDIGLVARLQRNGVSLDLETRLTRAHSPLGAALMRRGLGSWNGVCTCIIDHKDENGRWLGLAQMQQRPRRPDYVITFLAPALSAGSGAHAIWQRLLAHLCVIAGERGGQRLCAGLPTESEEYQVFRHVGFAAYAQEDVFEWRPSAGHFDVKPLPVRRQRVQDSWGLQQLYASITPRVVQSAEGSAQGEWDIARSVWPTATRRRGFVWESQGEILAAFQLRSSAAAHWLRLLLHPDLLDQAEALVAAAMARLHCAPHQRVYCAVRTYEAGIVAALDSFGFKPIGSQTLVVKYTTAWVREPLTQALPALNGQVERAVHFKCKALEYNEDPALLEVAARHSK